MTYYGDTSRTVEGNWNLVQIGNDYYSFTGVGFTDEVTSRNATFYLKKGRDMSLRMTLVLTPSISRHLKLCITGTDGRYDNGVTNNGATVELLPLMFHSMHQINFHISVVLMLRWEEQSS